MLIQIIPRHFVDADRARGFDFFIDALIDQIGDVEFVDEEDGGVAVVKNQRMAERIGFGVKTLIASQAVKDAFVKRERVVEIVEYLLSLGFEIAFIENRRFGDQICGTTVAVDLETGISAHVCVELELLECEELLQSAAG